MQKRVEHPAGCGCAAHIRTEVQRRLAGIREEARQCDCCGDATGAEFHRQRAHELEWVVMTLNLQERRQL